MRKPAVISVVGGLALGFMAVQGQRIQTGGQMPWWLAVPLGLLAAAFLYGIAYRNLKKLEEAS